MGKWPQRILITLGVLAVIGGAAYYWLIVDSSGPSGGSYSIDMAEVRRLADSIPGDKVQEIHVEHVASFTFPATAIVAGDGWDTKDVPVQSYQLVFPDHTAIIDTALDKELGKDTTAFYSDAYDRMIAAMDTASLIVITHEHLDHIGGLAHDPHLRQLMNVVKLTKEQIASPEYMTSARLPDDVLASAKPLVYDRYLAIAPGVVLIKAPGHTPGSQMVFVQRADGTEYLFLGDVAWTLRNVELVRERARLVTRFFLNEDHDAVMLELAELHRIHEAEPNLHIIPGHDASVLADALKTGLFIDKFK
ncbi:MAG: MBL fold metallo-hydrolase [Alphaproteobacteria bacterium]|nr:MBL fold metallo-hydrolase [Alphaproteobacteria bacterium]